MIAVKDRQASNSLGCPSELDVLVGKKMLFKVEVTDGNLHHSWRNYGVKRTLDDSELIKQFMMRHKLNAIIRIDGHFRFDV